MRLRCVLGLLALLLGCKAADGPASQDPGPAPEPLVSPERSAREAWEQASIGRVLAWDARAGALRVVCPEVQLARGDVIRVGVYPRREVSAWVLSTDGPHATARWMSGPAPRIGDSVELTDRYDVEPLSFADRDAIAEAVVRRFFYPSASPRVAVLTVSLRRARDGLDVDRQPRWLSSLPPATRSRLALRQPSDPQDPVTQVWVTTDVSSRTANGTRQVIARYHEETQVWRIRAWARWFLELVEDTPENRRVGRPFCRGWRLVNSKGGSQHGHWSPDPAMVLRRLADGSALLDRGRNVNLYRDIEAVIYRDGHYLCKALVIEVTQRTARVLPLADTGVEGFDGQLRPGDTFRPY